MARCIQTWAAWGVLAFAMPLVGCSSEPTDGDARAALQRHFAEAVKPAVSKFGSQAGSKLVPVVQSVELKGCTVRGRGQYLCDAQVSLHSEVLGQRQAITRLLLARDSKGWMVLSQL